MTTKNLLLRSQRDVLLVVGKNVFNGDRRLLDRKHAITPINDVALLGYEHNVIFRQENLLLVRVRLVLEAIEFERNRWRWRRGCWRGNGSRRRTHILRYRNWRFFHPEDIATGLILHSAAGLKHSD